MIILLSMNMNSNEEIFMTTKKKSAAYVVALQKKGECLYARYR
jgi:hypothetical protein